jgi:hypothetical protein
MNMSKKFLQTSAIALGLGLAIASATTLCSTAAEALTLDLGDVYGLLDNGVVRVLINNKDETIYSDYQNVSNAHVKFKPADRRFGNMTWEKMLDQVPHWNISIDTDVIGEWGETQHVSFKVSPGSLGLSGVETETVNDVLNTLNLKLENCNVKTDNLKNNTFKDLTCTIKGSIAQ